MSIFQRAQQAIEDAKPTSSVGRKPKGKLAGIKVHLRIDPTIIVESYDLTGLELDELIVMAVHVLRRAKLGVPDADLAFSVRSLLRKAA